MLVLAHERRRILHFGVTAHPPAEWTAQQLREAIAWTSAPRYLLRDRARIFGCEFTKQVKELGIEEVLGAPRAPGQRAYIERVIGTIRRDAWTTGSSSVKPACLSTSENSRSHAPELAEGHARVTPRPSSRSPADRGDSGGGWAPSSVRTSRRLNRWRLIDRRGLFDRGPRRSQGRRQ